ncbi:MAG TPA: hypothetical protein VHZ55_01695 [Bryobacteraceae bacterium]|nr:hypothetical protein [Bryobacteraceae bacterium]
MSETTRRDFLVQSAGALASTTAPEPQTRWSKAKKTIGIQIGAVSFADEGVEPVLDVLQEKASVNTLFIAAFTYGRGIAGRQVPGQPLPDHGKQEYDTGTFHGGSYAAIHSQYYANTPLKNLRAPDLGSFDVFETVLPVARKRGMKNVAWFEDVFRSDIPGIEQLQERDLHGRKASTLCLNNPGYRNFLLDLVEDYARSWDLDGIMWGSERQGAFANALGSHHGGGAGDPGRVTCFCEFCRDRATAQGIRVERARSGFLELEKFVREARSGRRPVDGYYVELWRLTLTYPELLAWENLWHDSLRDTYQAIYKKVKSINPALGVGWHIWHNNSFSPIYRAEQDLHRIAPYSDFLKIVMYHNCAGERMASYINSVSETQYGDVPRNELLQVHYRVLGYGDEGTYDQIPQTGFSSDYVLRETKRARAGLADTKALLWPGIDIDIPTAANHSKCTPKGTQDAVLAAFHGGADGIILSRKYSEMMLANLAGAGAAIRQLRLTS